MERSFDTFSEATKQWICQQLQPIADNTQIVMLEQLPGGISSHIYGVTLRANDELIRLVMRQIDDEDWLNEQPDAALQEASALQICEKWQIAAPQIIACDAAGEHCGKPSVLMTRLEGTPLLQPRQMDDWLGQLAAAAAGVHQAEPPSSYWTYKTYQNIPHFTAPAWSKQQEQWHKLLQRLKQPAPSVASCFIHRDFHPANVLWSDEKITGIVDWTSGCIGPAGIDIGHCRINLVMLHGVAAADRFLHEYKLVSGNSFVYDPYWDILSLIDMLFGPPEVYQGWVALGITHLTDEMMVERIEAYTVSLADKLN